MRKSPDAKWQRVQESTYRNLSHLETEGTGWATGAEGRRREVSVSWGNLGSFSLGS